MTIQTTTAPAGLDRDGALRLLAEMLRIRRFEETCAQLYMDTRVRGFVHLYIGEEAIAAGVMAALTAGDRIVATYREHGHALARGVSANACMAEMFGKATGCSGGRGGSMHLFDAATRFYGGNAIVGGGIPLAVGTALADKLRGAPNVSVCFFGEGAVAEGEFHESMNLAELWQLPVLFVCENNLYAMGTRIDRSEAQTDLITKAAAYRVPAESIDGMDVLAVREATRRATAAIRTGGGPRLLEFRTYRFRAHSMYDPELYRDKREVEEWKHHDPIASFVERLRDWGWASDEDVTRLTDAAAAEMDAAVAFAEAAPWEPVEQLTRWVYSDRTPREAQREEASR